MNSSAWNLLRGITVVSLEQAVAAPLATARLADAGARVIKIERKGTGDFARQYDKFVHGECKSYPLKPALLLVFTCSQTASPFDNLSATHIRDYTERKLRTRRFCIIA